MNEEEIRRGREAKRLLEHPLIVETLDLMEEHYMRTFRHSKPSDSVLREEAHRTLCVLDMFKRQLTSIADSGKLAVKAEQDRLDNEKERELESSFDPRS